MKVQVKNLRKQFGKTVAVDNISFAFDSGHIFGFVGPNGAGKTTTMRMLATLRTFISVILSILTSSNLTSATFAMTSLNLV